jgi:hypothetical protein
VVVVQVNLIITLAGTVVKNEKGKSIPVKNGIYSLSAMWIIDLTLFGFSFLVYLNLLRNI